MRKRETWGKVPPKKKSKTAKKIEKTEKESYSKLSAFTLHEYISEKCLHLDPTKIIA
jgi:hypothetical protein